MSDTAKTMMTALCAAGYKPKDRAAAERLIEAVADTGAVSDPTSAAKAIALLHPAVFGEPGKGERGTVQMDNPKPAEDQTDAERAAFLRSHGHAGSATVYVEPPITEAKAEDFADGKTPAERAKELRARRW